MRIRVNIRLLLTVLFALMLPLKMAWGEVSELDLKAVFLERFTRFVEWPAASGIDDPTKPFIICVVGQNQFGARIAELSGKLKIRNKKIVVHYISHMDQIDKCHLLFISEKTNQPLSDIINYTKDKPILTVSDTEGYGDQGVYINYYSEKNKLRFEINQSAVQQSQLKMGHMLLQRARILNPTRGNNEDS